MLSSGNGVKSAVFGQVQNGWPLHCSPASWRRRQCPASRAFSHQTCPVGVATLKVAGLLKVPQVSTADVTNSARSVVSQAPDRHMWTITDGQPVSDRCSWCLASATLRETPSVVGRDDAGYTIASLGVHPPQAQSNPRSGFIPCCPDCVLVPGAQGIVASTKELDCADEPTPDSSRWL